jgi:putative membrane protein
MKNKLHYPAILSCILLAACGQANQNQSANTDSSSRDTALLITEKGNSSKADTADLSFFKDAAIGGMTEVEAGSRMLIVSTDEGVKKFAQIMVTDHTKAGAALEALAQKKGIQLPTLLPESNIQLVKNIDKFKSDGKNEYYAHMMVEDHIKTVDLFNKAKMSKDPDIAAFAKATLPTLEHHYKMAKEMEASVTSHKRNQGDDPLKISDRQEIKH